MSPDTDTLDTDTLDRSGSVSGRAGDTPESATAILRRGVAATPELRRGLGLSVGFAFVVAAGRVVIPIAIQQILDRGISGPDGYQPQRVAMTCAVALVIVVTFTRLNQITYKRLLSTAENVLFGLRTRAFDHIHRLSMAHHNESHRGVLVARVTSDIETLAQFASWGAVSWVVNLVTIAVVLGVMAVYSWQLAALVVVALLPVVPIMRFVQRHQLAAYDQHRTSVSGTLSVISETVAGRDVIRGDGQVDHAVQRLADSIEAQYRAQLRARFYFAIMFPISDVVGGITLGAVAGVGIGFGPGWGLSAGTVISCLFFANLVTQPLAEIGEVLDQTQTALSGWRKVLDVLAEPVEISDPEPGETLPDGPISVEVDEVTYSYIASVPALTDVSLTIDAGTSLAVVGETGSGKSTLAKLLCRLADAGEGTVSLSGHDITNVSFSSLRRRVHLVPQDGFLFDGSIAENVQMGRPGATPADADEAIDRLGLRWWVDTLPAGMSTQVGERGGALSVGERQLVALARALLADPGLLVLDEATSAVDPETERALSETMVRLAGGRTVVSVAHRLSTAEAADLVAVFDRGHLVQLGSHDELVADAGGVYANLQSGWVSTTRRTDSNGGSRDR